MKWLLISVVAAGLPQWIMGLTDPQAEDGAATTPHVMVFQTDGEAGEPMLVELKGDGNAVFVTASAPAGADGRSEGNTFVVRSGAAATGAAVGSHVARLVLDDAGKDRGWLGVSIASVSDTLSAQLGIDGDGIVINNVVEGSPADDAGLQSHDIVLAINGKTIDGSVGAAVSLIGSNKPGDVVDILVLRDGEEFELSATLGERKSSANAFTWKFEVQPDGEVEDVIRTHGRIMLRDGEGHWVMKDLGNLNLLNDLPENLKMFLPSDGSRSVQVFSGNGDAKVNVKVVRDGMTTSVSQDGGDEITVIRADEDGEETETVYANLDELKAGDEEAYELFNGAGATSVIHIDADGLHGLDGDFNFTFDTDFEIPDFDMGQFQIDLGDFEGHVAEWREHLEESLGAAKGAHGEAMEQLHALLEEMKTRDGEGFKFLKIPGPHGAMQRAMAMRHLGKPKHTFEVQSDGSIKVLIRKGDSELVQIFSSENDLANRSPDLYDKFDSLMELDDE